MLYTILQTRFLSFELYQATRQYSKNYGELIKIFPNNFVSFIRIPISSCSVIEHFILYYFLELFQTVIMHSPMYSPRSDPLGYNITYYLSTITHLWLGNHVRIPIYNHPTYIHNLHRMNDFIKGWMNVTVKVRQDLSHQISTTVIFKRARRNNNTTRYYRRKSNAIERGLSRRSHNLWIRRGLHHSINTNQSRDYPTTPP